MRLADLVTTFDAVRATRSRKAKTAAVAEALRAADLDEVPLVASYLMGSLRQRRTGVGWRSLTDLPAPAAEASLGVSEVDAAFEELAGVAGAGSQSERRRLLEHLVGAATEPEQALLRGLVTGEIRTGALEGVLVEGIAAAFEIPVGVVRRAVMLAGSAPVAAGLAATGGEPALRDVRLEVGRPVQPMLAGSAPDLTAALASVGLPCLVDGKLDGIRIQAHRSGDEVRIWSRSLDDLTDRFPELVSVVRELPASSLALDGEALLVDETGRPRAFQETASRSMTLTSGPGATEAAMTPYFFDVLHLDGRDLIDVAAVERAEVLAAVVPPAFVVPRVLATTEQEAADQQSEVLARGHEGVVVKSLDGSWEAGRRGSGWVKVKPRHTLDLVVLAVEWGSGRRRGLLSNIHLGARDPSTGGWVMLGKTFKGMTDEMLAWQTERFLALETYRDGHVVHVQPVQVVEIAFDGLQRSTRYPGGLALRFARVLGYREDKRAEEADTIETVRDLAR
ncbi:ATP-dependent DNA ligase [Nocardioides mangrovicus]|uniref:DNA ligase n=1 Tax=Nocardioides mangrovicus TaxID=2478913 RepID=A0A3L8P2R7_9ACTN|nr:ATP-dependent DNA ligase [Nocardioides mangrovicus]RLV49262.1 ATP-dependent DNA ligase [Nocardioides mangrovicus]